LSLAATVRYFAATVIRRAKEVAAGPAEELRAAAADIKLPRIPAFLLSFGLESWKLANSELLRK
jgi:hypothetical protein